MRASQLDWSKIDKFSPGEWPDGVLEYMDDRIIYALRDIRVKSGCTMWPSPVYGAHVRHDKGNRHNTLQRTRLADATDFFTTWKDAEAVLETILLFPNVIKGFGVYDSMKFKTDIVGEYCMFHIDTRPVGPVCWWGQGREPVIYVYMQPFELLDRLKEKKL